MHRTIGYLSKRFVDIRPGEGAKVFLTFLYFFLIITAYYVIKPVSRSLVLGDLGSRMVPYVDLVSALLMGPIVTLFARLVDRLPKPRLVSAAFLTVAGILVVFWRLVLLPATWISGVFAVWVSIFSVLVVMLFWLVANDLYRPRDAKRLFGFIGSGGILGGIVGSSLAAAGAQVVGTEHLLLVSAGLILLCWVVVKQLWKFLPAPVAGESQHPQPAHRDTFLSQPKAFAKLFLQSRYLMLLLIIVALTKIVSTLIYYQFNPYIEQMFPDQNAKTTFTGLFFGGMNVLAFVLQFFCTSWVLRRWGLVVALWVLPIGLLFGTFGLIVMPVFWVASMTELYDGSMNYSLQQTTKEVLYLPIDRSVRYKVKPFIDMVVFRFGKGAAAIIGIIVLNVLHVPARYLSYLVLPLVVLWLVVALRLRRDYVATIRTMLQAQAAARRKTAASAAASSSAVGTIGVTREGTGMFGSLMEHQPSSRKLELVDRLVAVNGTPSSHIKDLVTQLAAYEGRVAGRADLDLDAGRLKAVIGNPAEPMAKRRQAIRLLARRADPDAVDFLFGLMLLEGDAAVRQETVKGLVRLRMEGVTLDIPIASIRRQMAFEVANYRRVVDVATIYRHHDRTGRASDDPVLELLRLLAEESVEQIFRLLMLIHRPEDIHLIYEHIRAPDAYVRADAIELLDNLVDADTRAILVPILDEDRFLAILDEETAIQHEPTVAYRVLQEAIWDHNCWLSVTALCAVGRLGLTTMRQELVKASHHHLPIVATAAKIALHLTHAFSNPT